MQPHNASPTPRPVRCAIYTRKSSEEGLEKEFNSLDAQREAAEAYISSQKSEGWVGLAHKYDDGGWSGANLERPALRTLLKDIEGGSIDCVVVYKVDRLSRSLLDFARIMGTFEQHGVSFVSVTQQFNTATPVGRLTLHILLSFAEFEREIISERTRDKKAAARQKGKWIGGCPVLGYDVEPRGGHLVVNQAEAQQVRDVFRLFAESGSLEATLVEVQRRGWRMKSWTTAKQARRGGGPFTAGALQRLLTNELYTGVVVYRGKRYRGEQEPIVGGRQWRKTQDMLRRATRQRCPERNQHGALLQGVLHCARCNQPMRHTYTSRKQKRYRYYVCLSSSGQCRNRVPAQELERSVLQRLASAAPRGRGARKLKQASNGEASSSPELITQLRAAVERIGYDQASGQVSIRLRARKEQRHDAEA